MGKIVWAIWILNGLLQWVLLGLVIWRKGWQRQPAFLVYVGFCAIKTTLLFLISFSAYNKLYFNINWSARLIGLPVVLAVLIEVFASVFRPYATLPGGTLRWFRGALIALVTITTVAAVVFPGRSIGTLAGLVFLANRSMSVIFCGAFSITALMSGYFGIPWQTRTYGIGVGFLLYMAVDLFISGLVSIYGIKVPNIVQEVGMLAFTLGLTTWITYFCIPDAPSRRPTLDQARRLQKALDATQKKVESLP